MARYTVVKLGAKTAPISMVVPVTAASQATVAAMQQAFSKAGATGLVTSATVAASAPATAYVSAVQAAKASTAKALIVLGLDTTCIGTAGALKSLGASPKAIVVDNGCMDQTVLQHYGGKLPTNWVVFNFGNSPYVPGESTGVNSYLAAMKQYAPSVTNIGTTSSLTFGTIMTADKIANSVGYANITPTSMSKAAKAFTGAGRHGTGSNALRLYQCRAVDLRERDGDRPVQRKEVRRRGLLGGSTRPEPIE